MNTKIEQPYYTVYAHFQSAGEIWVNDVFIMRWMGKETEEGVYSGELPVNQLVLQNGTYTATCKLLPRHGRKTLDVGTDFTLDFGYREVDKVKPYIRTRENFDSLEIEYIGEFPDRKAINPVYEGLPYYELSTKFEVTELPFVLDGWQNSVDLKEAYKDREEELKKEVLVYYRQIHALLAEHNATKFLELSKEKEELQSQAFYFTEERKKSFRDGASALFGQNLEVEPLREKELVLQFMGYGKLIRLIYPDGSQPIQFKSPKPEEQSNIEFDTKLHMRSKEKGFSII